MARNGLTKSQVRATRDRLVAEGRYPSVDTIRHALGDSGSKSTIHRFLKELREEEPDGGARREETGNALHALVEQLADRLHLDFDERVRDLRAGYEQALLDKEAELAALRRKIAVLEEGLARQNAEPESGEDADTMGDSRHDLLWTLYTPRPAALDGGLTGFDGFGSFDDARFHSRSCSNDASPFSTIRAAGR